MTPERWQQLKSVFFAALERPANERTTFLEQACGDDQTLQREAERLLAAGATQASILDASPEQLAQLVDEVDLDSPSRVGATIGPYRILEPLGQGGMGTVYLAERDDVDKRVALKVVRGARSAAQGAIARFLAERRILARLEHPNIARLLDAGFTGDGTPFFAMEHVANGTPLTAYSAEHGLGLEARLALFVEACEAVRYAHQSLVVHRDLKPSNILVRENEDGTPTVKLVDFGIAKLIAGDEDAVSEVTRTGLRVMTPSYAAPEQVRGEAITTATDVYALGVVLYELLTGCRPYELQGLRASEVERQICETDPLRPSTAVRGEATSRGPTQVSDRPPTDPRRLSGDLDSISMQALAKDPYRRYASVDALIDDLRRHRAGLPVRARPHTAFYQTMKFVRRHRWSVATGAMIVLLVAGITAFYTWRLANERDRVVAALAESETVTSFLIELFESQDPDAARGEDVSARTLLTRGLERADALSGEPVVQARMLDAIGQVQVKLGQYEAARPPLERALALRRQHLKPSDPAIDASISHVTGVLRLMARYDEAESLLHDALAASHRRGAGMTSAVASLHNDLGALLLTRGEAIDSEIYFRQALAANRVGLGADAPAVATNLGNLAYSLHLQERYDEAERHYRDALAIHRHHHGDVHTQVALVLNNLAVMLQDRAAQNQNRADDEAAEPLLREVLSVRQQLLGTEHPNVATARNNLGVLLVSLDRPQEAEPLHREALAVRRQRLPDDHPLIAASQNALGRTLTAVGQHGEAEEHLQHALAFRRTRYGDDHPLTANVFTNLGFLSLATGDLTDAEQHLRAALAVYQSRFDDDDYRIRRVFEGLAGLEGEQGAR